DRADRSQEDDSRDESHRGARRDELPRRMGSRTVSGGVSMAKSRAGDWVESRSRLSRRLRKLARYTLNPTPMRSRSLYSTGMLVSMTLGVCLVILPCGSLTDFV